MSNTRQIQLEISSVRLWILRGLGLDGELLVRTLDACVRINCSSASLAEF